MPFVQLTKYLIVDTNNIGSVYLNNKTVRVSLIHEGCFESDSPIKHLSVTSDTEEEAKKFFEKITGMLIKVKEE